MGARPTKTRRKAAFALPMWIRYTAKCGFPRGGTFAERQSAWLPLQRPPGCTRDLLSSRRGTPKSALPFLKQPVKQTDHRSHQGQEKPHGQPIGRPTPRLAGFELDDCEHVAFPHLVRDGPFRQPRSRISSPGRPYNSKVPTCQPWQKGVVTQPARLGLCRPSLSISAALTSCAVPGMILPFARRIRSSVPLCWACRQPSMLMS